MKLLSSITAVVWRTIVFFLFASGSVDSQSKNATEYPYGADVKEGTLLFWYSTDLSKQQFYSEAEFRLAQFHTSADFREAQFHKKADFSFVQFYSEAEFRLAQFHASADFREAQFHKKADFSFAQFDNTADFREVRTTSDLSFEMASIKEVLLLGSHRPCNVDLSLALLHSESRIVLTGFVQLKLPVHKFQSLQLLDTLSYTQKEQIVGNLKAQSYKENLEGQFELDYILAQSTKYQEKSDAYEANAWYLAWRWPKWFLAWFYDVTMGLGYRPFRIVLWGIGIMMLGAVFFFFRMGHRVNAYIAMRFKQEGKTDSFDKVGTLLNCAYFSVMLFFTFRFNGQLLTFFDTREKRFIVAEWALGLSVYIAFLYHTSSVLQIIRSLFVGG